MGKRSIEDDPEPGVPFGYKQYTVKAELSPGNWVTTYEGNNYDRAVQSCDFWDERVDVEFTNRGRPTPAQTIEAKWHNLFWRINNDPTYGH